MILKRAIEFSNIGIAFRITNNGDIQLVIEDPKIQFHIRTNEKKITVFPYEMSGEMNDWMPIDKN